MKLQLAVLTLSLAGVSAPAADEIVIPKGTSVDLRLIQALSTRTAQKGDRFRAAVVSPLYLDGRLALPEGTEVEGQVERLRSAKSGAKSGVLGIEFVRLHVAGGAKDLDGELVSLRNDDRKRLLELAPKLSTGRRIGVVLIGAAKPEDDRRASTLVGIGGDDQHELADDWAASGLGPAEVDVPAGAIVSMEFDEAVHVPAGAAAASAAAARRILVSTAAVSAAQRVLKERGYYGGEIDGLLGLDTRRALVKLQLEKGQLPTGDLDEATGALLGVTPPPIR